MFLRPLITAIALSAAMTPAFAGEVRQDPKAVLELFTSQGCSSCPEADALLDELSRRPDVVALAYHVDYWDYIGWSDTFGTKANSDRQRDYAQSWGSSRIFTPQMVINGQNGLVGSRDGEVAAALKSAELPVDVQLAADDGTLDIAAPAAPTGRKAVIWLVTFIDRAEVSIERGENKGKKVAYTQIVTGRQVLGMWEPGTGARLRLPLDEVMVNGANGAAVLIQEERNGLPGPILGAASYIQ